MNCSSYFLFKGNFEVVKMLHFGSFLIGKNLNFFFETTFSFFFNFAIEFLLKKI